MKKVAQKNSKNEQVVAIENEQLKKKKTQKTIREVQCITLSEVERSEVKWLWPSYLPTGKLVVLDGDPGVGKTTILIDIVARLTRGDSMPDGSTGTAPIDAIWMSLEDDAGDTLGPRLDEARGDRSKVHVIQEYVTFPDCIEDIRALCIEKNAKLLVIDPISSYLNAKVDSHRDPDVRRCLNALRELAKELNLTVVLVRHLNKKAEGPLMYRGQGSIAFVALSRVALFVGKVPNDPERRVLAVTKSNLSAHRPSLCFRLVAEHGSSVAYTQWTGTWTGDIEQLVNTRTPIDRAPQLTRAEEFLSEQLRDSSLPQRALVELANKDGISKSTLDRAKNKLGIKPEKNGNSWFWGLPKAQSSASHTQIGQRDDLEHLEYLGVQDNSSTQKTSTVAQTVFQDIQHTQDTQHYGDDYDLEDDLAESYYIEDARERDTFLSSLDRESDQ